MALKHGNILQFHIHVIQGNGAEKPKNRRLAPRWAT